MSIAEDDLDRLMSVMRDGFDPYYGEAWTRRQVEDALLLPTTHYCLVGDNGQTPGEGEPAAGFWLSRCGYEEEELLLLAVVPQLRGRGLGKRLLQTLRDSASSRGAKRLLLEMRKGNDAEFLYRTFGFYPIGERRDYYLSRDGHRIDAVTFACDME